LPLRIRYQLRHGDIGLPDKTGLEPHQKFQHKLKKNGRFNAMAESSIFIYTFLIARIGRNSTGHLHSFGALRQ
jgi:hypothetical protein